MQQTHTVTTVTQAHGHIELDTPEIPEGTSVEVVISMKEPPAILSSKQRTPDLNQGAIEFISDDFDAPLPEGVWEEGV